MPYAYIATKEEIDKLYIQKIYGEQQTTDQDILEVLSNESKNLDEMMEELEGILTKRKLKNELLKFIEKGLVEEIDIDMT